MGNTSAHACSFFKKKKTQKEVSLDTIYYVRKNLFLTHRLRTIVLSLQKA